MKALKKRKLGNIEVSEIGMGCMGFSHGYRQIPDEKYSIEAIRKAYEGGCTFFDTAEGYGAFLYSAGHNERLLGTAVKPFRDKAVLATKFHFMGNIPQGKGKIYSYVRSHLEQSLKNLQTDTVELYYLHRVNRAVPIETVAECMGRLIDEGLIKGWGLSQVEVDTIAKAHEITPVSAVQNLYNMLERDCERNVIPYCLEHNIGVVPFSPVASGFLSGNINSETDFSHSDDVRKFVPQLTPDNQNANRPFLDLIKSFANKKNASNAQIAIAWMLHKYPSIVPIPGSKNSERILENLGACNISLSNEEFITLDKALSAITVHGHRGCVEFDGDSMKDWNR